MEAWRSSKAHFLTPRRIFDLGLAPEDFVVSVGVEGGIDVNEVDAGVGEFLELGEVVATVDDAGVEEGGGFRFGGRMANREIGVLGGELLKFGLWHWRGKIWA